MKKYKIMKLISQILFTIVIIFCLFLVLVNTGVISMNSSDEPLAISLNQNEIGVKVGGNYQLEATVFPENVNYGGLTWTSSDKSIASVNKITGYVTAHKIGDVVITAKLGVDDVVSECIVHVVSSDVLIESLKISASKINMAIGKSYTIKFKAQPYNTTMYDFTFTSSDTSVAIVNENGVIKAVGEGTAVIKVKSKVAGVSDSVKVVVYKYSNTTKKDTTTTKTTTKTTTTNTSKKKNTTLADTETYYKSTAVKLSSTSLTLEVGASSKLSATVEPSNASQSVNWTSSNTTIATVSNGVVTGLKAGTVNIIATSIDGVTSICKVTVKTTTKVTETQKEGIDLGVDKYTMEVGDTKQFTVSYYLPSGSSKSVVWTSSNKDIAEVTSDGVVSAKKKGSCVIKVASANDKYSDYVTLVVKDATSVIQLTSITFDKSSYSGSIGSTVTLKPVLNPNNATNRFLTWTTSNRNVATVDSTGLVTFVGTGTATITASNGTVSASVKVTSQYIEESSVSIEESSEITLTVGATKYLSAKITPTNATNQTLKWSSTAPSIVSINTKGKIEALSKGTATIKVTTDNGKTSSIKVTVE